MEREPPRFLVVGHLNKPHGTRGEIFVWPLTDHPEGTFAPGVVLYPGDGREPDPDLPPLRIEGVRPFRKGFLLALGGVLDRTAAEALRGQYVMRALDDLEPLADGEVFYHELLGMEVVTADGAPVGRIREVYELRPADLLEIERAEGGSVMIPFLDDFVVSVDRDARRMVVDPPAGLLDL